MTSDPQIGLRTTLTRHDFDVYIDDASDLIPITLRDDDDPTIHREYKHPIWHRHYLAAILVSACSYRAHVITVDVFTTVTAG